MDPVEVEMTHRLRQGVYPIHRCRFGIDNQNMLSFQQAQSSHYLDRIFLLPYGLAADFHPESFSQLPELIDEDVFLLARGSL